MDYVENFKNAWHFSEMFPILLAILICLLQMLKTYPQICRLRPRVKFCQTLKKGPTQTVGGAPQTKVPSCIAV